MRDASESPEVKFRTTFDEYKQHWLKAMLPIPQNVIQIDLVSQFGRPVSSEDLGGNRPATYTFRCSECGHPTLVWQESDYSGSIECRNANCKHGKKKLKEIGIVRTDYEKSESLQKQIEDDYIRDHGPFGFEYEA